MKVWIKIGIIGGLVLDALFTILWLAIELVFQIISSSISKLAQGTGSFDTLSIISGFPGFLWLAIIFVIGFIISAILGLIFESFVKQIVKENKN